jgi:hypothetical protein
MVGGGVPSQLADDMHVTLLLSRNKPSAYNCTFAVANGLFKIDLLSTTVGCVVMISNSFLGGSSSAYVCVCLNQSISVLNCQHREQLAYQ